MSHPRPFRFGLLAERARSRDELIQTARAAEAAGFDIFLLRDHWLEEPFGHQLAPLPALAVVAEATARLRIGTMVLANDYRHPVLLAKEVATLDLLSGGRFELGLGAGFLRAEYAAAGLPFDPPGIRVERLTEAVRLLKTLFAEGQSSFAGRHYRLRDLPLFPRPVQRPHPPLLIAGAGPRMLALAAREADIIGVQTVSTASGGVVHDPAGRLAEAVAAKIETIRAAAGPRFARIELSVFPTFLCGDDPAAAARRYAAERGWTGLSVADVLAMPDLFAGTPDEIAAAMQERRDRYAFSYYVVTDRNLDLVAPVVARLAGR